MKLSPFLIVLIIIGVVILCYIQWLRIKADMVLYGDDFWPRVIGSIVLCVLCVMVIIKSK